MIHWVSCGVVSLIGGVVVGVWGLVCIVVGDEIGN